MAQWLGACIPPLAHGQSLFSSTRVRQLTPTYNSSSKESNTLFWCIGHNTSLERKETFFEKALTIKHVKVMNDNMVRLFLITQELLESRNGFHPPTPL